MERALMESIYAQDTDIMRFILLNSQHKIAQFSDGYSPLQLAITMRNPIMVSILLNEFGADKTYTPYGHSPLKLATIYECKEIFDMLTM
jgi:ankyrin repeat protein